jgi:hypothetical protein
VLQHSIDEYENALRVALRGLANFELELESLKRIAPEKAVPKVKSATKHVVEAHRVLNLPV